MAKTGFKSRGFEINRKKLLQITNMRNCTRFSLIRRSFLMTVAVVMAFATAKAQTDIAIGTGTVGNTGTTYPCPVPDYFEGQRAQYLYRASELVAAGMGPGNINAIKFNITGLNTFTGNIQQYAIKIGGTSVATLSATAWENVPNTVFNLTDIVPVVGINTFTFVSPFFWNGTDNIIVEICNGLPANVTDGIQHWTNNPTIPWTTGLSFNGSHTRAEDQGGNLCNTPTTTNTGTQTTRPNIIFNWTQAPPCTGTPNPGTATGNPLNVCLGQPFTLQATGVTVASGLTYQWESSLNNTTWAPISGATNLTYTGTQGVTTYYRLRVTCTAAGGGSATTTAVLITSPPLVGGTFTINKTQATGGTNFNSFNDAYNAIKCGINNPVIFNVVPGTGPYNEQLIMNAVPGTSPTRTVTFNGNGETIGFSSTNTNERAVIKLVGANWIVFDSLTINASAGTYGYGVQFMSDADSNVVRRCNILSSTTSTSTNFAGIVLSGSASDAVGAGTVQCDYNLFDRNTITGGYYGITLTASLTGASSFNTFSNNRVLDFYQYGLYTAFSLDNKIKNNTFARPTRTSVGEFIGIHYANTNVRDRIDGNTITNPFGGAPSSTLAFTGISFNNADAIAGDESIVFNNLICNVNGNGAATGILNVGSDNILYLHNTISLDNALSTATGITRGFAQTAAATIAFYDNIITIGRGGAGVKHCIYAAGGLIPADNNVYFISSSAGTNYIGYYTTNRTTFTDWKTATGQDANGLNINPVYTDPAAGNFAPGNAGIDNKGFYVGVDNDILNVVRSTTTPDIGAYEFTPPLCVTPPNPGTTIISEVSICQNSPVLLNLNIGAYGSSQTFQWESSATQTGTYTPVGAPKLTPDTVIIAGVTRWYRAAVRCGASVSYSNPVLLTVIPALPSATYTINKGTATTYVPGVPGGNFQSFADAKTAMQCGITGGPVVFNVVAGSGPYNEQFKLDAIKGVTAVNNITFNGNGNTIFFAPTVNTERAVIKLNDADHIIFDSLTIDASSGATVGYGVQLINNADSNTFRRCNIISSTTSTTTNYAGVVINATDAGVVSTGATLCDFNLFDRNTITGGYYGVTLMGSTTQLVTNNRFTRNTIQEFYLYGMYVGGSDGTLIENNLVTRPTRAQVGSGYGLYFATLSNNGTIISKNRITKMFGGMPTNTAGLWGIYHNSVDATSGAPNIVSNNLLYDLDGMGGIYALYNLGSDNVLYYHNTVAIENAASTAPGVSVGFYQTTQATGIDFKNNLITITRGGNGTKHAIYLATSASTIDANNNNYFLNAGGTNNFTGYYNGNIATLANWKTTSGKDANSLDVDPLYISPATGNYKPATTPLDNKGVNVNIATDILNIARSTTTPDIGAYEFAPPPCTVPPVAGTAVVTPNTGICLETPIHLTATGHSPLGAITFQWQSSADGVNWTNLSGILYSPDYDTVATTRRFYRCAVTCNTTVSYTNTVTVTLNAILAAGTYTINGAAATTWPSGTNFQTFGAAVSALLCGVGGPVIFNVANGTYVEQIRIPYIPGTSAVNTVRFVGAGNNAHLRFGSMSAGFNYTLKLDSAQYFTFRNLIISSDSANFGRVVEFANTAHDDSLVNCTINAPVTINTANTMAAVYGFGLRGQNLVVKGNTINNGSAGVFFSGTSVAIPAVNHIIDSNTVNNPYFYGIYAAFTRQIKLNRNTVNMTAPLSANSYSIYTTDCDSSWEVMSNKVNVTNTSTIVYGVWLNNNDGSSLNYGKYTGNDVKMTGNNTGTMYGTYISNSPFINVMNNTIAMGTSGPSSFGLYNNNSPSGNYYNNSVNSISTSGGNNFAAYFLNSSASGITLRNNIFSHKATTVTNGRALYVGNSSQINTDYNMYYTNGTVLVQRAAPTAATYANLNAWRNAAFLDRNSIVYEPAFVANDDLRPNLASRDVWAIHGRGQQVDNNNFDHDNKARPTTLIAGVPDLGAYEFLPTSLPTVLTATPAVPAPATTQTFMYGTDTVMKITWGTTVPSTIEVLRYSGVVPTGLNGLDSMYFYTKVNTTGPAPTDFTLKQFYIDPWQGSIPSQYQLGLGRTTQANQWVVGFTSRADVPNKYVTQTNLTYLDKFTGLVNPYAPPVLPDKDSSNMGRRFWVGYPVNQLNNGGNQAMVIYMSAQQDANVQIKVNGTSWVRNYFVPANTVSVSENMPVGGADNSFVNVAGLTDRGISITSDVPIVVYSHTIGSTSSGAAMLMPVGVWGYEYGTLGITQDYGANSFSYFYVISDNDNTKVEITTPLGINLQNAGMTPGVPFSVVLNKGEYYQVVATSQTEELSGSIIKSVPNAQGKCFPIASFSGSSRTAIGCPTSGGSGGDFIMQQNFPASAWGKRYLTAPSSASTGANVLQSNIYRVAVKDPLTPVFRNGQQLTGLQRNFFYEFTSNTADYITSDKPIMVAQFLTGACVGVGDPEMMYISPIEQGINKIGFYRNNREAITNNYLTMIIPTGGMASLQIVDGATTVTPDFTYLHPNRPGYTVVVKGWGAAPQQVRVQSDSAFTAITYGLGSVESYGYNAGTLVKNLQATGFIANSLNPSGGTSDFTCVNTPFRFSASLPLKPTVMTWKFSAVPNLTPNADVTVTNPVPLADSVFVNGVWNYRFTLPTDYRFSAPGIYPVQLTYSHPSIESCDKTQTDVLFVQVLPAPKTDFRINFTGCAGDIAQFIGDTTTPTGIKVNQWGWTFHDGTTAPTRITTKQYNTPGTFNVTLSAITNDGCIGDSVKTVTVTALPVVNVVQDSIAVCTGVDTVIRIQSPLPGAVYSWYTTATGGTPFFTGTVYTVRNVRADSVFYISAVSAQGCASTTRKRVKVTNLPPLTAPVPVVSAVTPTSVTWTWPAVTGAVSYVVSTNGGTTYTAPSGPGLSHTVNGLANLTSITILVRSVGSITCQTGTSQPIAACTDALITINPDSIAVCVGQPASFAIQTPQTGITYTWYTQQTGGTAVFTGTTFSIPNVAASGVYYVSAASASGCTILNRKRVVITALQPLAPTTITWVAAQTTNNSLTFTWTAVAGAAGYQVSTDNITFVTPSSGAQGLTHTVSGLNMGDSVRLWVRAIGTNPCQQSLAGPERGGIAAVYVPNAFTPNGDGRNDLLMVYGNTIRDMEFAVFSQWGEKMFTTRTRSTGWDGNFKGKPQPVGVYVYVLRYTSADGTVHEMKGSINLIR